MISIFDENDNVLLLGEGNFSFSTSLCQHNLLIRLTASCFETLPINDLAVKNIEILKQRGVTVLFGVDATDLTNNGVLNNNTFDKIIFNFPHVCKKMRLDLNRQLLQKFFESAEKLLKSNGKTLVTLCNGQGGTNFDNPQRRWNDTWKIKEMAAYGNFVLTDVVPFKLDNFPNYKNTGFRGQDKKFTSNQPLAHIFTKTQVPNIECLKPDQPIIITSKVSEKLISEHFFNESHVETFGPPFYSFDLTFCTTRHFKENIFYIVLYNNIGRIIKNVEFLRIYEFPNSTHTARTYRITYHAEDIPLHRHRIINIHEKLILPILKTNLDVVV